MKRQLKFRAWFNHAGEMATDFFVNGNNGDKIIYDDSREYRSIDIDNDLTIMQFTGLLDKNCKEIYEGDIFKHVTQSPFDNDKPFEIEIGIVEWGVWSYMYGNKIGKPHFAFDRMKANKVEVIGNIYENAELLAVIQKPKA